MATPDFKIVVFDLDETLGCFVELFIFISAIEAELNKNLSSTEFYNLLDVFPVFVRPKIFTILKYLKEKKEKNNKIQVMIYTNNQGPRSWTIQIKDYFENKLNYKLFDKVICAFKVKGKQIEMCRTTHNKTITDFLRCTQMPKDTKICFLDDQYHEEMKSENVYYINVKPYYYNMEFKEMAERYYDNIKLTTKSKGEFVSAIVNHMNSTNFKPIKKDEMEQKIDVIVGKKIISHLNNFFRLNVNDRTRKNSENNKRKTRKNQLNT